MAGFLFDAIRLVSEIYNSWPWLDRAMISGGVVAVIVSLLSMHRKLDQIIRLLNNRNNKS